MKIIKAGYEIWPSIAQDNVLQRIEQAGRVCYKSESNITDDSAKVFCSNIIKRGHEAVLEHGVLCFEVSKLVFHILTEYNNMLVKSGFKSFLRFTRCERYIVSANVRAWRDFCKAVKEFNHGFPHFFKHITSSYPILFPEYQNDELFGDGGDMDNTCVLIDTSTLTNPLEIMVHNNVTVKFIVDRGVSHEIVRHRTASFCQESQRYCNYSKDKFGNEITFIEPLFWDEYSKAYIYWKGACSIAESDYFSLLKCGATPQEARTVLPNSVKTEVVMTANCECWHHFFALRTSYAAHPQMREVAIPLLKDFTRLVPALFNDIEVRANE
jgi:thymidylate synthase (FAD)